jgi:hypothetical protein
MPRRLGLAAALALVSLLAAPAAGQTTLGSLQGHVTDEQQGAVPGATVTVRNVGTNVARTVQTNSEGRYRVVNLAVGDYEVTVELTGFAKHVRSGITLAVGQEAVVDVTMKTATIAETITVEADAPIINTTNAEVGVRFDSKRVAELPIAANRNVFNVALSAPGVSQLGTGQAEFAAGTNFSVNGMRVRSNNFMIDGQDSNDPSVSGRQQPVNNPDIVQEIRLITNQYSAEYGRNAGSIMNVITKSGNNAFHGSLFWFENRCGKEGADTGGICLNARNNLEEAADRAAGRDRDRFRTERQVGGSLGGPIFRDKTFFFGAYQRWTDDRLGAGFTLNGAPTEAGRQILQQFAGDRPQVEELLRFLPAAQAPIAKTATFTVNGVTHTVPLGSLTGEATQAFENDQALVRLDHHFTPDHVLTARWMLNDEASAGQGQVTPPGLGTTNSAKQQAGNLALTSVLSSSAVNELRVSWQRLETITGSVDPSSEEIPSIEISELGLTGFNAATNRTAIGLAVNLPQFRNNDTWQFTNTFSLTRGAHSFKLGVDARKVDVESFFFPTVRGRLAYSTLNDYVQDTALLGTINRAVTGGQEIQFYNWWDFFAFVQDEWRVRDDLTLNLGLRYETPGNSIASLFPVNEDIVAANGGDQRFALDPKPKRDTNNFQPRVGFNWNPRTDTSGLVGFLTGGDKMVVRGGYARTHDYAFININLNIASAFPFVGSVTLPAPVTNAFTRLQTAQPNFGDPNLLTRTIVSDDFRAPAADQFSFEVQRQIGTHWAYKIGYVGTKGSGLFQTLDGNPNHPFTRTRVDPSRGVIRERSNSAESTYHSLQTSLEKRLTKGFSAGIHYTWSRYTDTASEIFNPSSGEVAVAQDSFDLGADEGRSSYDRPHRVTGNMVYELPFYRDQQGFLGKLLGGWQVNAFFTIQSGAPFTVLNGADPTGALSGIDALVGSAIRPMLNTDLDLSDMTIQEILDAGGARLFRQLCGNPSATCAGERVGNVPRNSLRADGIENLDIGFIKTTRIKGDHRLQIWIQLFNALNHRNFGIPESRINSANFLNEKGTDGGSRRIVVAARYLF